MSTITAPLETAELLIALSEVQKEIQAAKLQLQQLLAESAGFPKSSDGTVASEIAKAVNVEAQQVNVLGIRSAISILEAREKEIREQLAAAQKTEIAQQAEADVKTAISQMKKLSVKLEKSVAVLLDTINEMRAIETQHGSSYRRHLASIRRAERPLQYDEVFRAPREKLLKIEDLRLPVLRQGNGVDGDIRWYGDAFTLTSEPAKIKE